MNGGPSAITAATRNAPHWLKKGVTPMSETQLTARETGRRERKRLEQLERIANLAWALFESEGFEAVTMERIGDCTK